MTAIPDKAAVHRALRAALEQALAAMVTSAKDTADGATHEENRSEGDKDMRATEQSYLARGQAMRAEQLAEEVARLAALELRDFNDDTPIGSGALVRVAIEDETRTLFFVAQGGGTIVDVDGVAITVITPGSPLGRALLGKRVGDDFELLVRGQKREGEILAIR